MVSRIADKINIDNICFERHPRSKMDKAVVTFGVSNKNLRFNPKMTKLLSMRDWTDCIVGYDRKTKVIVLKQCDSSEFTSTAVRKPSPSTKSSPERVRNTRTVCIGAVANTLGLCEVTAFRAERNGNMIFLEELEKA